LSIILGRWALPGAQSAYFGGVLAPCTPGVLSWATAAGEAMRLVSPLARGKYPSRSSLGEISLLRLLESCAAPLATPCTTRSAVAAANLRALDCVLRPACSALRALPCMLWTACSALRAPPCVLWTACSALHAPPCVLWTACSALRAPPCVLWTACSALHAPPCMLWTACSALRAPPCVLRCPAVAGYAKLPMQPHTASWSCLTLAPPPVSAPLAWSAVVLSLRPPLLALARPGASPVLGSSRCSSQVACSSCCSSAVARSSPPPPPLSKLLHSSHRAVSSAASPLLGSLEDAWERPTPASNRRLRGRKAPVGEPSGHRREP
jgi:hypothetical protein